LPQPHQLSNVLDNAVDTEDNEDNAVDEDDDDENDDAEPDNEDNAVDEDDDDENDDAEPVEFDEDSDDFVDMTVGSDLRPLQLQFGNEQLNQVRQIHTS
jgi:hypothetical protein